MKSADHPIWGILSTLISCVTLTVVLWIFAQEFDSTEWKAIATFAGSAGIMEYMRHRFAVKKEKAEATND